MGCVLTIKGDFPQRDITSSIMCAWEFFHFPSEATSIQFEMDSKEFTKLKRIFSVFGFCRFSKIIDYLAGKSTGITHSTHVHAHTQYNEGN